MVKVCGRDLKNTTMYIFFCYKCLSEVDLYNKLEFVSQCTEINMQIDYKSQIRMKY